jgi:hypothetical protein
MWSPAVAIALRRKEHDVVAVLEREDLRGAADEELLELARRERRVIVTRNVGDFSAIALQLAAARRDHFGLLLVPPARFDPSERGIGALVRSLETVLGHYDRDDALVNDTLWLTAS